MHNDGIRYIIIVCMYVCVGWVEGRKFRETIKYFFMICLVESVFLLIY